MEEITNKNNQDKNKPLQYEYILKGSPFSHFIFIFFTVIIIFMIWVSVTFWSSIDWSNINSIVIINFGWFLLFIPFILYPRQKYKISFEEKQVTFTQISLSHIFPSNATLDYTDIGSIEYFETQMMLEIHTTEHKPYFTMASLLNQTKYQLSLLGLSDKDIENIISRFKQYEIEIRTF